MILKGAQIQHDQQNRKPLLVDPLLMDPLPQLFLANETQCYAQTLCFFSGQEIYKVRGKPKYSSTKGHQGEPVSLLGFLTGHG